VENEPGRTGGTASAEVGLGDSGGVGLATAMGGFALLPLLAGARLRTTAGPAACAAFGFVSGGDATEGIGSNFTGGA